MDFLFALVAYDEVRMSSVSAKLVKKGKCIYNLGVFIKNFEIQKLSIEKCYEIFRLNEHNVQVKIY